MYSANLHDQLINAAFPLKPLTAWAGGACTVTVAVPPAQSLAGITIESVTVQLALPSGTVVTQAASHDDGSYNWVATFAADAFATSGFVAEGFTVNLIGRDETGASRVWIVSKGDLEVRSGDAAPDPVGSFVVVKLRDSAPETPVKGDAYISGGRLLIYDGSAWQSIGVTIDATLTQQGAAADAKAVGDALRGGFTAWEFRGVPSGVSSLVMEFSTSEPICWILHFSYGEGSYSVYSVNDDAYATSVLFDMSDAGPSGLQGNVTATRHLITPTKTSQLQNDGDGTNAFVKTNDTRLSDARTPTAHTHAMADVTGLNDVLAQKANTSDLPYRLVEPGKWEFSGVPSGMTVDGMEFSSGNWELTVTIAGSGQDVYYSSGSQSDLMVEFATVDGTITATRASLPGHLCDRAGNLVVVSGDTTLTLPDANPGYLRDFLVRLEISGSTVPTITFAAPTGETITYETDGDEFPVPDEAGTWSYSFTENCVAHKFAVSLKKANEVAQAAQGGS